MVFWSKFAMALKSATTWTRAVRLFEIGRHDDALQALNTHFDVYRVVPPSIQAPIRSNLLLATLAFWVAMPDVVRDAILTVLAQVKAGRTPYNAPTNRYIVSYCSYLDQLAANHYQDAYVPVGDLLGSPASVVESDVRSDIRRIFPLG